MDNLLLIIVGAAVILAVAYAIFNYFCVKKMEEGTDRMGEIAGAVRIGANAFIRYHNRLGHSRSRVSCHQLAGCHSFRNRRGNERDGGLGRYENCHLRQRARNQ